MSDPWTHEQSDAALWACWAEEDQAAGLAHCRAMIEPHIAPVIDGTYLDYGCGVGRLLVPFAMDYHGADWHGLDTSQRMLGHARAACKIDRVLNVELWASMPPPHVSFDAVYSVVVLQHLEYDVVQSVLDEVHDSLRAGGVFRFQFVPEGDEGPLNHPCPEGEMASMVRSAGFVELATSGDPQFPTWRWATATKGAA